MGTHEYESTTGGAERFFFAIDSHNYYTCDRAYRANECKRGVGGRWVERCQLRVKVAGVEVGFNRCSVSEHLIRRGVVCVCVNSVLDVIASQQSFPP
jgi:hypothetical protein